jgi:hypothetical protein
VFAFIQKPPVISTIGQRLPFDTTGQTARCRSADLLEEAIKTREERLDMSALHPTYELSQSDILIQCGDVTLSFSFTLA